MPVLIQQVNQAPIAGAVPPLQSSPSALLPPLHPLNPTDEPTLIESGEASVIIEISQNTHESPNEVSASEDWSLYGAETLKDEGAIHSSDRLESESSRKCASGHVLHSILVSLSIVRTSILHTYCILLGRCDDSDISMRDQSRRNKNHDSYAGKDRKSAQEEMDSRRTPSTVPQYVLDYAPFVYLYSQEEYWPCDIAKHLLHTTPYLNYTPAQAESDHAKLRNLDDLNEWGQYVYLTSNDNVIEHPIWLQGKSNIPSSKPQCKSDEESKRSDVESDDEDTETCSRRKAGHSEAPAVLIVVEKEDGVVDAFWFFFYSFNKGNTVFDLRFGNHIGDWEHTTVRFVDGEPSVVYLSEHDFGDAYTYEAVEKKGKRVSSHHQHQ